MPKAKTLESGVLRVRMYRVGFGDCFLVSLPDGAGHAHVLVDCGVHPQGDVRKIADAVKDIRAETGGRLDVVIASHAHKDHISGFASNAADFLGMTVGEVWLPWIENANDAQAARIRKKQLTVIERLSAHFAARPPSPDVQFMMANLTGNAAALQLLKAGINGGKVRYLAAGETIDKPAGLEGLSVKVLGPPRDEKFLSRMDPPAGDRYLKAGAGGRVEPANEVRPFIGQDAKRRSLPDWLRLSAAEEKALRQEAEELEGLAFALNQAVNNTSVVALFSIGGQHLLFPGDAQYGNWASWLDQPDSAEILSQLTFFKIAHHGSENATPRRAIEHLTDGQVAAMVSTQNKPWPSIPRKPLIQALDKKTKKRWVRSDSIAIKGAPNAAPAPLKRGFTQGAFWYDYTVTL